MQLKGTCTLKECTPISYPQKEAFLTLLDKNLSIEKDFRRENVPNPKSFPVARSWMYASPSPMPTWKEYKNHNKLAL
jgi:hypothetical protein